MVYPSTVLTIRVLTASDVDRSQRVTTKPNRQTTFAQKHVNDLAPLF